MADGIGSVSERLIYCPYCGESIVVLIDSSAGEQDYYEDCSVCCRPIRFCLLTANDGSVDVVVKRDDET
jgi:hypothetical protein